MIFANKSKLDWAVKTEPIKTKSGIVIPDYNAIIREDTKTPLSVVSKTYVPFQNEQLMDLLFKVSKQTGVEVANSGFFGNGEKVFIQLKTNDLKMPKGDKVEGYVTGINSFDGSTSLSFGNSSVTISCQNTFFAALKELKSKIRHTKNMLVRVDEVCKSMEDAIDIEKKMFERIKRMSEVRMTDKVKDLVVRALFDIDSTLDIKKRDGISTMTKNKMSRFDIDLQTEVAQKGDNIWGLFSGVTRYTTHSAVKGDSTETKLFGVYGNRERKIFNQLAESVN